MSYASRMPRRLLALLSIALLVLVSLSPTRAALRISEQTGSATTTTDLAASQDSTSAIYIIRLHGEPLATAGVVSSRSSAVGLLARSKPDFTGAAAQTYKARLASQRQSVLRQIQQTIGRSVTPVNVYDTVLNGMAAQLTGAQAAQIAKLPGVVSVERQKLHTLDTDYGPQWIGADKIWNASVSGVYAATILGANQVPAVASPLSGRGIFSFNSAANTLGYNITITGFSGASPITAAHFHRATDSSVAAPLTQTAPGVYAGSVTLSASDATLLQTDKLYVNFHTAANPGGEVRGNISGYKGEGVVVGIIDSGINTTHGSFAAVGGDGYHHINPLGAGKFKGACDPANVPTQAQGNPSGYNPLIVCNDKLIGTWTFSPTFKVGSVAGEPSPNDSDGHGTHTASTVAGNVYLNALVNGGTFPRISGVAPHANIIAYDVCGYLEPNNEVSASCPSNVLLAAIEQATKDGVDVINMSISGGVDPWNDTEELAFLAARGAGIVVSVSAGNDGPAVGSVNHVSPWLLSVAASSHNRKFANTVTNIASTDGMTLTNIPGLGLSGPLTTSAPIVYAANFGSALCGAGSADNPTNPFPAGTFTGKIVICDRGTYGRVQKAEFAKEAGAVGFILTNTTPSQSLNGDPYPLPAVHISSAKGSELKAWIVAHPNATAQIGGFVADTSPANGDILAGFSSLGPSKIEGILKPDIAAPGVDIIAAYENTGPGDEFNIISGTSMASPHTAGSAALLVGLHPDWLPGQIQSALTTTSKPTIIKTSGVGATTPFESGAGRVQVDQALLAGLVLDESVTNFKAADPSKNGDPRTLNIPSFADPTCVQVCTWTRTVKSTLGAPVTWTATTSSISGTVTVTPASFTIQPGGTQTFTVTYSMAGVPANNQYLFASVTLSASGGVAPSAHFPIAAKPTASDLTTALEKEAFSGIANFTLPVKTVAYTNLDITKYGLVKGTPVERYLLQTQEYTTTLTVPANTARLVAEIASSRSKDIDLFIYKDNGDGVLDTSVDTRVCASATGAVLEYCNQISPSAGTYFVRMTNYTASKGGAADLTKLVTALVPATNVGNFAVVAPTTSAGGPISLTVFVNEPTSVVGDIWYGWFKLTDTTTSQSLGSTSFDFNHTPLRMTYLPLISRR